MGGLNEADRLKANGVEARKASITRVPIMRFQVEQEGPTAHPRWAWPMSDALRAHVLTEGVPGRFKARETGVQGGVMGLELIDGARRLKAGLSAEEWLREHRPRQPPLVFDRGNPRDEGRLYVDVDLVACSDVELMFERLAANSEPGKVADTPSVLAAIVTGLAKLGCEDIGAIVKVMPRGVGPKEVQALARWGNLAADLRPRFDSGEAPIGLLSAVLDAPRKEQAAALDRLLANGVRTAKGATRAAHKAKDKADPWARRMSPRTLVRVADSLRARRGLTPHQRELLCMIAVGFDLSTTKARETLDGLPLPLADAIREARAKPKRP